MDRSPVFKTKLLWRNSLKRIFLWRRLVYIIIKGPRQDLMLSIIDMKMQNPKHPEFFHAHQPQPSFNTLVTTS